VVRIAQSVVCCGLAISLLGSAAAVAQTAQLQAVGRMLVQNQERLQRYSWSARTEVTVGGELQHVSRSRVAYDSDRTLKRTPLEEAQVQPRRSGKLNKKTRAFLYELEQLTETYNSLDPATITSALARAHAWEGQGEQGRDLRIQVRGVVRQGDTLDLWVDTVTRRPRLLEVLTSLSGEPVRLTTRFEELQDGPSYAAMTEIETELKEKKMLVRTVNSELEETND
jgi:hypothetical protein